MVLGEGLTLETHLFGHFCVFRGHGFPDGLECFFDLLVGDVGVRVLEPLAPQGMQGLRCGGFLFFCEFPGELLLGFFTPLFVLGVEPAAELG